MSKGTARTVGDRLSGRQHPIKRNDGWDEKSRFAPLVVTALVALFTAQFAVASEWIRWNSGDGANRHWYKLTETSGTWVEAKAQAEDEGGHLVTIETIQENTWVLTQFTGPSIMWIGLYQDTEDGTYAEPRDGWKWIGNPNLCRWETPYPGGSPCFTNWNSSEPNQNVGLPENYAEVNSLSNPAGPGEWNDLPNAGQDLFGIIERDTPIPTLSEWGVVAMTLLLMTAGTIVFARRRMPSMTGG